MMKVIMYTIYSRDTSKFEFNPVLPVCVLV
jgi:hypothetical protein